MMDAETRTPGAGLPALTIEALDPLFWLPSRYGVDSAWYGHVPFAHWLVGVHRPSSIVELGAHNGVSYAAFCEAVLRGKLNARALAVDTWQGDEHAGFYGEDVYTQLKDFHDQHYAAFSTMLRATFDEALRFVPDGSVDLLHIDGRHRYEDVSHDFETWRPKLSGRAIVLFHDTNVHERDFGVWRLWSELRSRHPSFEFLHGHGLGVLACGEAVSGEAAALCSLSDDRDTNVLRERFALLGERWIAARDLRNQARLNAYLASQNAELGTQLSEARAWGETAQAEVNRLFPHLEQLTDKHRRARAELAQMRHDLAARDTQMAELQGALSQRDEALAELDEALAELRAQAVRSGVLLDQARAESLSSEQARAVILASTSWRVTRPLRRLAGRKHVALEVAPSPALLPASMLGEVAEPPLALAEATRQDTAKPGDTSVPAGSGAPRALFISGEANTPGHFYRIDRYVQAARQLGYDAYWTAPEPVGPADLAGIRFVVMWRVPYSSHIQGIVTVTHEQGGIVIFDVDDLMFRPEIATVSVIDGIRTMHYSEFDTQNFFARIALSLRASDVFTCPTEELAREGRRLGVPAYVLRNGFDDDSHRIARAARQSWSRERDDLLRIGYAGGSRTHQRDFAVAVPGILRILADMPNVRLTLFRDKASGEGVILLNEFPELAARAAQIEWRDIVPLADLPCEMARFDVNIAPLERGNVFCECKSELKFFEAALTGVPTIATPSGPFARAIIHGRTGMLAEDDDGWHAALHHLLTDAPGRARMAQAAYHVSLAEFGPRSRETALSLLLAQSEGGAPGAAAFERELHRAGRPRLEPPEIPDHDVAFISDRGGEAVVTVIIPVFNYADVVPEALASAAGQSLQCLDLVVIDDCSPDDSHAMVLDWLKSNAPRFNRVSFLKHRRNEGLGLARNSGFAAARTEFVLPLDADNRLRPKACERLLETLKSSKAAFAYPAIQEFGDKTGIFGQEPYLTLRLQIGNYIDAMALVRKSAWAAAGGYDHPQHGWEDFDFWCCFAEAGLFGLAVPDVLADYRVHGQSMLHTLTDIREHRVELCKRLKERHPWLTIA